MAVAYYFNYTPKPQHFKNSIVETQVVGRVFFKSIVDALQAYGIKIFNIEQFDSGSPEGKPICFITIYDDNGFPMQDACDMITAQLSQKNELVVDFIFEPLINENSNDEIIADIKSALIKQKILEPDAETHTSNAVGRAEKRPTPKGGCYVATAVYGSYDCPEVWTLRRFRDFRLAKCWYGKIFIKIYYAISPILVEYLGEKHWFRQFWKRRLDILIADLKADGFEDTPYCD